MLKKIVMVFLILTLNAYAENFGNLQRYFANEMRPHIMLSISGYAHLNFIGGFSDGNYKLKSYSISPYSKHIYILNLIVEKKKHYFNFIQKFTIPFFYNGTIIAFKTIRGKKIYRFNNDDFMEIVKIKNGWKLIKVRKKEAINAKLPVNGGYLLLTIRKN